jgi:formylglycine-generating enzyme
MGLRSANHLHQVLAMATPQNVLCRAFGVALALLLCSSVSAQGQVMIETVFVGNAGNAADDTGYGSVGVVYRMGKCEVTTAQYVEFLNAVAATDTYGLYNASMWSNSYGCKIQRSGSSGRYRYSVAADRANRPVNYVSWGDAARFTNWLNNGQPTGAQDLATTEDGAYYLNGAITNEALMAVTRNVDAKFWIPTENEWYKAAYHKNDGITGNYFDYPTGSDSVPSNDLVDPDPGNNANFYDDSHTIGSPYYTTEVGEFENSASPYGTFDQGGNVFEWNEEVIGSSRGLRGDGWSGYPDYMLASTRLGSDPTNEGSIGNLGFRVASIAEPVSICLFSFYNNSAWDGGNGAANAADDSAIASDKVVLLPGQTATLANYTSYDKGINGLIVDVPSLSGTPTLNDFLFRQGNDNKPYGDNRNNPNDDWPWAPDPTAISVRRGGGQNGADRVTLIWEDGTIRNCWLQVTVLATNATGLAEDEVFYVGNAVGESGNSTTDAVVNATDEIGARNNPHSPFNPAPQSDPFDFNRDKLVNATDQIIARNNRTSPFTALKLITPPLEGQ